MIQKTVLALSLLACIAPRAFCADENTQYPPGWLFVSYDTMGFLIAGPALNLEVRLFEGIALSAQARFPGFSAALPALMKLIVSNATNRSFSLNPLSLDYRVAARFYFPMGNTDRWYVGLSAGQSFWQYDSKDPGADIITVKDDYLFLGGIIGTRWRSSQGFFLELGGVLGLFYVAEEKTWPASNPAQATTVDLGTYRFYPWGTVELSIGWEI
jgi:hypothetical protein